MHPFPSYSSLDHRDPHSFPTRRSSDLPLYKKYLETLPSETQTQAAQTGMKMCTDEAAAHDMERDKAAPEPTEPAPTPTPTPPAVGPPAREVAPERLSSTPPPAEHEPWYRRHPIGTALAAGGVV